MILQQNGILKIDPKEFVVLEKALIPDLFEFEIRRAFEYREFILIANGVGGLRIYDSKTPAVLKKVNGVTSLHVPIVEIQGSEVQRYFSMGANRLLQAPPP